MLSRNWMQLGRKFTLIDVILFIALAIFIQAIVGVAAQWTGPYRPKTEIDLGYTSLLGYSFLSLIRVSAAYVLSLIFTLTYGYAAAKSRFGETVLIPLLDILQSVPVLGFMPGLVLALVSLFSGSNLGIEFAAIVMIFTGEGWNMVFSFYSSLKKVPQDYRDLAGLFRLNRFEVLRKIELPYAMNGLLWNSMLSMAGGWFFLMTIESFTLGDRDFRLPGIGSYMAVAYEQNNIPAVIMGILVMFALIILVDRCLWAPLVAWWDRFQIEGEAVPSHTGRFMLELLRRSNLLALSSRLTERVEVEIQERLEKFRQKKKKTRSLQAILNYRSWKILGGVFLLALAFALLYGVQVALALISDITIGQLVGFFFLTGLTFLRICCAVLLGSLWTIPLGVFIGIHPKWTHRLQPVVQVVASFPAPMIYPLILWFLIYLDISLEVGAIVLMLFASQWYILFNVISGARLIPQNLLDVAGIFRVRGYYYWKDIILPAIFPSLVTGWITAAGGAWNASIVSEIVFFKGSEYRATGIGSAITHAAQQGDYHLLAGAILIMITSVVLINRFFWGMMYRLAETRYRLE